MLSKGLMLVLQIQLDVLDKASIDKAIRQIEEYRDSLDTKLIRLAKGLCLIGLDVVRVRYAMGVSEGNKNVDYEVIPTETGCKLSAYGKDVCFLEFGAGASTSAYEGEGQEGLPPIYPGSWSETEGKGIYAEKGYWYYNGEKLEGLTPKLGMQKASETMQRKAIEEAKKVFGKRQ